MFAAALAKYGKGQATDDLGIAVELLFERNFMPRLPPMAMLVNNDFRTERLYTEEVDLLFKQHQVCCSCCLMIAAGLVAICKVMPTHGANPAGQAGWLWTAYLWVLAGT